ncbi:MAG TPA: exodeoxyribonuclease VII small subunit [Flavobacteriaceae bacterium]|nr:exodeoxyribonuclease VII small subunit [Flavobacteriaceae bacterium]
MEEINYTQAFEELKALVAEMESGEISIDDLSQKVKRAAVLIKICKEKLSGTEKDVKQILEDLNPTEE